MGEEDRIEFEKKASEDKIRYEEEMASYEPPAGAKKTKKRKKDPNAPKRPATAFFLFSTANREKAKAQLDEGAKVGWCEKDEKAKERPQCSEKTGDGVFPLLYSESRKGKSSTRRRRQSWRCCEETR